jgi:amidase
MPLAPSFDTIGWFARDASLLNRVGAVVLGEDTATAPLRLTSPTRFTFLTGSAAARVASSHVLFQPRSRTEP